MGKDSQARDQSEQRKERLEPLLEYRKWGMQGRAEGEPVREVWSRRS